jgi:hypothetical protein
VTRWQRAPGVVWRRSDSKVVLLPEETDELLVLAGTGALTWELLADPLDEAELVALFAEACDTPSEVVAGTLRPFLDGLEQAGAALRR